MIVKNSDEIVAFTVQSPPEMALNSVIVLEKDHNSSGPPYQKFPWKTTAVFVPETEARLFLQQKYPEAEIR